MIGQKKILNRIDSFSIDTLPHSILFVGERGSGKHTLCKYISDKFKLPLIDITDILSNELIENIYLSVNSNIYLIDGTKITEKDQNMILKFLEEPLKNSYIIIISENRNSLLDTIVNRCMYFELEPYSKEELLNFTDNEYYMEILRTPGKIISFSSNIENVQQLVDKICDKLSVANYANTLTLVNKFNYSDEYDKIDVDIFLEILILTLFNRYKSSNDINMLKTYLTVVDERKKLIDGRLNKQIFIEHLLTVLWKEARNG